METKFATAANKHKLKDRKWKKYTNYWPYPTAWAAKEDGSLTPVLETSFTSVPRASQRADAQV